MLLIWTTVLTSFIIYLILVYELVSSCLENTIIVTERREISWCNKNLESVDFRWTFVFKGSDITLVQGIVVVVK